MPKFPQDDEFKVAEDIIFLTFQPQTHGHVDLTRLFFDLTQTRTMDEVGAQDVTLYFTVGYPTEFAELVGNLDDPEAMSFEGYISRFSKIYLETDRKPSMAAHVEFRVHRKQPVTLSNFDSISGSPVFFIYRDSTNQHHTGFAGMIRLGANNIFHVYEGYQIKRIIERI
jgi:hypothetical protein